MWAMGWEEAYHKTVCTFPGGILYMRVEAGFEFENPADDDHYR